MAISSLDIVRKFLVAQNIYADKNEEKIDSTEKTLVCCSTQKKQQSLLNPLVIKK